MPSDQELILGTLDDELRELHEQARVARSDAIENAPSSGWFKTFDLWLTPQHVFIKRNTDARAPSQDRDGRSWLKILMFAPVNRRLLLDSPGVDAFDLTWPPRHVLLAQIQHWILQGHNARAGHSVPLERLRPIQHIRSSDGQRFVVGRELLRQRLKAEVISLCSGP